MAYNKDNKSHMVYIPEVKSWLDLRPGSTDLEIYNRERVRSYLESNPGCMRKQVMLDLDLDHNIVDKAINAIRRQQGFKR